MTNKLTIAERIEALENVTKEQGKSLINMSSSIKEQDKRVANVLSSVTSQLKSAIEDTLMLVQAGFEVISGLIGQNVSSRVEFVVQEMKLEKMVKVFEANKARFMKEVEVGKFKKVDTISNTNPIVIGSCLNPDGSPYGAGVFLSSLHGLGKEMHDFFLGKSVGAVYLSPDETIVQIDEIYEGVIDETN